MRVLLIEDDSATAQSMPLNRQRGHVRKMTKVNDAAGPIVSVAL
jgi:hypothetical protein